MNNYLDKCAKIDCNNKKALRMEHCAQHVGYNKHNEAAEREAFKQRQTEKTRAILESKMHQPSEAGDELAQSIMEAASGLFRRGETINPWKAIERIKAALAKPSEAGGVGN